MSDTTQPAWQVHVPPGPDPWDPRKWNCRHCGDTLHTATDEHPRDGNLYDSAGDPWCVAVSEGADDRLPHERDTSNDAVNATPDAEAMTSTQAVAWFQRLPLEAAEAVRSAAELMEDPDPDDPGPVTCDVHGLRAFGVFDCVDACGNLVGMLVWDEDQFRVKDATAQIVATMVLVDDTPGRERYEVTGQDDNIIAHAATLDAAATMALNQR